MKTSELTGAALDWAVAKCEGFDWYIDVKPTAYGPKPFVFAENGEVSYKFQPTTNWSHGGPIIEREEISLSREFAGRRIEWAAWTPAPIRDDAEAFGYGDTPLIAAMRCYVASKLGDEVEIPEEF